ncbi:ATP-binding cassette domain-containing protein [Nereida sp. MMG025]|uniref:thiamine ABC transporter ATP-binding protein n=1 Tax=Nereida sp. MMG025 TaxID=2909981 RepID=UPI001F01BB63|nr:ATP-binding cassette domain-containing protein [Nereida sp. MMG025]MCF6444512.1 ATP-binding cassette domain-containing protein [Nereida sp. MMG025]
MLELDGVDIQLGTFRLQADLRVPKGACVAVMGASGSGKSTLINAIAGFQDHLGAIRLDGTDLSDLAPDQRPLSILFQDGNLFPHLTAAQNVALGLSANLRLSRDDWVRVDQVLHRVGLGGKEHKKPTALSGGQQSRVAIARVLLRGRPLLLLDEPFAALGPALRQDMLALVAGVAAQEGTTVLMITHAPEDARAIADQTIVVENGRAAAPCDTQDLLDNPPDGLRAYLGT